MLKKIIRYTFITACFLSTAMFFTTTNVPAETEETTPEQKAFILQSRYNSLTSLTFSFDQVTRTGTRERKGSGQATFYRYQPPISGEEKENSPTRQSVMRWNYTEPDPQVIISDGETLSIYTEKDKQLIRTPAKELESDITYAFFAGTRNLLDDFEVHPTDKSFIFSSAKKLQTLLLIPRQPHNQIRDVQVWFDNEQIIHHLVIRDHFDSVTELTFLDIKADKLEPGDTETLNEIINFPLPPGTEIISR